ncbi:MAG: type II toxin-antitoxin system YafQ family toxin [Gammaproteobacteria bacterium]|nr:type II toxin-antitoxin system YafQ family toxin [Gammaproteobacteria bacterium]
MLDIVKTKDFKRDIKKLKKTDASIVNIVQKVVYMLINKQPLPDKYKDHALKHNWQGFRDCHIKPDLVLIYKITDNTLELHRLNSHSNLF